VFAVCTGVPVHVSARMLYGFKIIDVPDCQRHEDHLHGHPRALVRLAQATDLQSQCIASMSGLQKQTTRYVNASLVSQLVSRALLRSVAASLLCCMPRLPVSQACGALSAALQSVSELCVASSVSLMPLTVPCAKSPGGRLCIASSLTNTGLNTLGNHRVRSNVRGVEVCQGGVGPMQGSLRSLCALSS